jgi:hypothetical protein
MEARGVDKSLVGARLRPLRGALVIAIATVAGGCGTITRYHAVAVTRPVALMQLRRGLLRRQR